MGQPKGLCLLPGRDLSFLAAIAGLYVGQGWPWALVTTTAHAAAYRRASGGPAPQAWIIADGGEETARTVEAAWTGLAEVASQLWIHPVDLPLVSPRTMKILAAVGAQHPDRIVRPTWHGQPGHPVVMPRQALADVFACRSPAVPADDGEPVRMRDLLAHALQAGIVAAPLEVAVTDAGVVTDADRPRDLARLASLLGRSADDS